MTDDGSVAALEEAFSEELRRVEELRRRLPAPMRPSLRELADRAQRSHNTIDNWLSGRTFPADVDTLAGVIALIGQAAAHSGVRDAATLLDPDGGGSGTARSTGQGSGKPSGRGRAGRRLRTWPPPKPRPGVRL